MSNRLEGRAAPHVLQETFSSVKLGEAPGHGCHGLKLRQPEADGQRPHDVNNKGVVNFVHPYQGWSSLAGCLLREVKMIENTRSSSNLSKLTKFSWQQAADSDSVNIQTSPYISFRHTNIQLQSIAVKSLN